MAASGPVRRPRTASSATALTGLALAAVVLGGCMSASPTPAPPTAMPPAVRIDPRLGPALAELAAHPAWTAGIPFDRFTVTDVLPETTFLCVELSRPGEVPFAVSVDVRRDPWRVVGTAYYDPAVSDEPQEPYSGPLGADDPVNSAEACRFALGGHEGPFPGDPSAIDVHGYMEHTPMADAIRQALVAHPEWFGIDRVGTPSVLLMPGPIGEQGEPLAGCLVAGIYVGGPRSMTVVRLREVGLGAWRVERVRITNQALARILPPDPDGC